MPIVLLGNSVYPLLPWLIKPFPHTTLSVTGFCLFEGGFDSSFFLLILALLEATLGTDLSYHLHEYYHHHLCLSLMNLVEVKFLHHPLHYLKSSHGNPVSELISSDGLVAGFTPSIASSSFS